MRKQYLDEIQELEELKKEAYAMDGIMATQLYAFYDMRLQHFQWELGLKDKLLEMSEEEQLKLLSTDGMLVKRPLVVGEKTVLTGFSEKAWTEQLLGEKTS